MNTPTDRSENPIYRTPSQDIPNPSEITVLMKAIVTALGKLGTGDDKLPSELIDITNRGMRTKLLAIFGESQISGFLDFLLEHHGSIITSLPPLSYVSRDQFRTKIRSSLIEYNESHDPAIEVTEEQLDAVVGVYYNK